MKSSSNIRSRQPSEKGKSWAANRAKKRSHDLDSGSANDVDLGLAVDDDADARRARCTALLHSLKEKRNAALKKSGRGNRNAINETSPLSLATGLTITTHAMTRRSAKNKITRNPPLKDDSDPSDSNSYVELSPFEYKRRYNKRQRFEALPPLDEIQVLQPSKSPATMSMLQDSDVLLSPTSPNSPKSLQSEQRNNASPTDSNSTPSYNANCEKALEQIFETTIILNISSWTHPRLIKVPIS